MNGVVHVIGAGLAGLAAATRLAAEGRRVVVHEAARMAGGRCRSYYDQQLGLTIDNGNHLLLACNHAAMAYLARIGAKDALTGPDECVFDFVDLSKNEKWRLRPNDGRIPWWIFAAGRRVPGTKARDYLGGLSLLTAGAEATVADALATEGALWERLWKPVLLSALNTPLDAASARLAAAVVRESLGAGGAAARPRAPAHGLGPAFVDPALEFLAAHGAEIRFGARLRTLQFAGDRAATLDFGEETITLGPDDAVVFAAPAWSALELLPDVSAPREHCAIFNAHFAVAPPAGMPLATGVVGAMTEWLFAFPDRLSVTISAADAFIETAPDEIGARIWREVAAIAGMDAAQVPPTRIVKEKRATFAATPAQDALRPQAGTRWRNLFLAGDWTQTGLPATIEGAIRSGERAAEFAARA
ncbi:MAG TPA: hydroxysqualene dehydroxylase HpnE [Rhodoblastus sp.]|nr:hydroxysqualene dehydroxylase HpnE [Rhodoblastus sp.]